MAESHEPSPEEEPTTECARVQQALENALVAAGLDSLLISQDQTAEGQRQSLYPPPLYLSQLL